MIRRLTLLAGALLLAACSTMPASPELESATASLTGAKAGQKIDSASAMTAHPAYEEVNAVWLGAKSVKRPVARELPAAFDQKIHYNLSFEVSLQQVAEYIRETSGVPVVVTEDAREAANGVQRMQPPRVFPDATSMLPNLPNLPNLPQMPMQGMPGGQGLSTPTGGNAGAGGMQISYEGSLTGFLDQVASQSGTSWKYTNGRIVIFSIDTRVFNVEVLPGSIDLESSITNQSDGAGSGGGSGQGENAQMKMGGGTSTQSSVSVDQFESISETVKGMLTSKGTMTASWGQIVVTDVPTILDRVDEYIDQVNHRATRQVAIDMQVYLIERNESNGYAIQWDAFWKSLKDEVGMSLLGGGGGTGGPSLGVSVFGNNSPFAGTNLFVDALAQHGKVRQMTSGSVVTLSGRPVPFQVAEEVSYPASVQTSLVPDVGQQTTRTAGKVTSGFSMVLLPQLTRGDQMLIQATINLSTLRELRRFGSEAEGNMFETPLVDSRQVMQNVRISSGQTLVLTGFEQETLRSDATGVGHSKFTLFGGGQKKESTRSTLVILITPRIVD